MLSAGGAMGRILVGIVLLSLGWPVLAADTDPLVNLVTVEPTIRLEMRYAISDNFLKKAVYSKPVCLLHRSVAERLVRVQRQLATAGYGLKLWDCYRPLSVQKQMWALVPNEDYVANPAKGSRHNRGAAVDLTLVDGQGNALEMPTAHDDFTRTAARASEALWSTVARRHYILLDRAMTDAGFLPLPSEWWHYDAPRWEGYPILDQAL